jgi:hypothetical protein
MHDCFGKPLKPLDRVRGATVEEMRSQGHTDQPAPLDGEQLVLPAYEGTETCNVLVVPSVTCATSWPADANGELAISLKTRGPVTTHTARTLVKLEG